MVPYYSSGKYGKIPEKLYDRQVITSIKGSPLSDTQDLIQEIQTDVNHHTLALHHIAQVHQILLSLSEFLWYLHQDYIVTSRRVSSKKEPPKMSWLKWYRFTKPWVLPLSLLQLAENMDGMETESHFILNTTKRTSKDSKTEGMI